MWLLHLHQCQWEFPKHHLIPALCWLCIRCSKLHWEFRLRSLLKHLFFQTIKSKKRVRVIGLHNNINVLLVLYTAVMWTYMHQTSKCNPGHKYSKMFKAWHICFILNKCLKTYGYESSPEFSNRKRLASVHIEEFTVWDSIHHTLSPFPSSSPPTC